MYYMFEYYKVTGCQQKYNQFTDALNKAISLGFYSPQANIQKLYGITTNKATAQRYTIVKETEE